MAEQYDEREARKAYVRRRQQIVFTITAVLLVVALVVSFLFYFRIIDVDEQVKAEEKLNYGTAVACAAKNEDGSAMAWSEPATVPVRVRNGTDSLGLAGAVKEALIDRQFNVVIADNFTSKKVKRTTIYYGVNAINPAYTLNSYFTDAVMVMDDRQDRLVDVVIGATFNDLKTDAQVKQRGSTIKDFDGCKSAEQMQKAGLPKAAKHNEVN